MMPLVFVLLRLIFFFFLVSRKLKTLKETLDKECVHCKSIITSRSIVVSLPCLNKCRECINEASLMKRWKVKVMDTGKKAYYFIIAIVVS